MFTNKTLGFQGHHLPTLAYVCVIQGHPAPLTDAYVSMGTHYDESRMPGETIQGHYLQVLLGDGGWALQKNMDINLSLIHI